MTSNSAMIVARVFLQNGIRKACMCSQRTALVAKVSPSKVDYNSMINGCGKMFKNVGDLNCTTGCGIIAITAPIKSKIRG